jgi:hypothetical protein
MGDESVAHWQSNDHELHMSLIYSPFRSVPNASCTLVLREQEIGSLRASYCEPWLYWAVVDALHAHITMIKVSPVFALLSKSHAYGVDNLQSNASVEAQFTIHM